MAAMGQVGQEPVTQLPSCNVAISGGGIASMTYVKVFETMRLFWRVEKAIGVSAGAIACACMLCYVQFDAFMDSYERVLLPAYEAAEGDLLAAVRLLLEAVLPEDAHVTCTDRLTVITTRVSRGRVVHREYTSTFPSRRFLINTLLASSRVPFITCKGMGWTSVDDTHTWDFDGIYLPADIKAWFKTVGKSQEGSIPTFVFTITAPSISKLVVPEKAPRVYDIMQNKLKAFLGSHATEHFRSNLEMQAPLSQVPWLSRL
jgi:hypothetical protein